MKAKIRNIQNEIARQRESIDLEKLRGLVDVLDQIKVLEIRIERKKSKLTTASN